MQIPGEATRLRIHIGANDTFEREPLVDAIIARARAVGLAGATAWRGITGFGAASHIHRVELVLSHDLPVVIELIDDADRIEAFLPVVQQMIGTGLVTRDTVTVLRYGAITEEKREEE
ncbi:MAG: DUF190 domain-containing protein [Alphaproteobacteria bacterium]|nr:DUF190 domain-containing protein [Alphaproteobacteria bacterium]